MSQLNQPGPSLRDRKRAMTWAALHEAAARTALEKGLEHVTIDAVAEAADVSPRTFFNYFPCKEDAVLGLREPFVEDGVVAEFDIDGDLLEQVSRLMLAVTRSIQGGADHGLRHELLQKYPHLLHRRFHYVLKVEQLVIEIVAARLVRSRRWAGTAEKRHSVEDTARMMVMISGAGIRYVMQKTTSHPTRESQFAALDQGLELMRDVLKELQ